MKVRKFCVRVGLWLVLGGFLGALVTPLYAVTVTNTYEFAVQPDVFMTELQTGTSTAAGEEFIELYNNSDQDIDFSDLANGGKTQWKLQYFAKTKLASMLQGMTLADGWNVPAGVNNTPTKTIVLSGVVPAHSYFVLSATGYLPGSIENDMSFSSGLASDGGALQLVSVQPATATSTKTVVHDRLVWAGEGVLTPSSEWAYVPPATNESLQRRTNTEDRYVDDENQLESWVSGTMSPKATWTAPVVEPDTPPDTDGGTDNNPTDPGDTPTPEPEVPAPTNEGLAMPFITELLPNPSSDESDEFIEIYNPNDEPFNLKGYELQTGTTAVHSFVITSDTLLPAEAYTVFTYADTKLALSNSGGRARLLNPAKQIVNETDVYDAAKEAQAWALASDGTWQWTDTPTPKLTNAITKPVSPLLALVQSKTAKSAKVKGVSTKKASASKPKKAKTTKPKKAKKTKSSSAKTVASVPSAAQKSASLHTGVLAAVVVAALAYVTYEYRKDVANFFAKFRRN